MVPWYNEEIKLAKKERRRAERKWRITKTTADLNVFKSLKKPLHLPDEESKMLVFL